MSLTAEERFNQAATGLEKVQKDVSELLKDQADQVKKNGETSAETAKAFTELNKRTDDHIAEVKALKDRFEELAQALQRPGLGGGEEDKSGQVDYNIGRMLTQSKGYKNCHDSGDYSRGFGIDVPHFDKIVKAHTGGGFQEKALTSLAASVGDAINPRRLPGFVDTPLYSPRLRNVIRSIPTSGPVEYVKRTNYHQLYALVDGSSSSGQPVLQVDNVNGFFATQSITIAPGTGSEEVKTVLSVTAATAADPSGNITLTTNLANTHAALVEVVSDRFVFTPETTLKPKADITLDLITDSPKVLAHMIDASRQILDDVPQLEAYVNGLLMESFALSEERQFLYGTNTGPQIRGILNESDIRTYLWSSGVAGDNKMDALRRAYTLASLVFLPVTATVIHPTDKEDIDLAKGEDGHYLWTQAPGANGGAPWRTTLVETVAIDVGTALTGAFSLGAMIYDRQMANVRVSEHHNDNFGRNMVTIRAEERVALAVMVPEAFCAVTFDNAPA